MGNTDSLDVRSANKMLLEVLKEVKKDLIENVKKINDCI